MRGKKPTEEQFLKDMSKHEMQVLLDNGIYRHLRCKQPGSSNRWFDIVTWPGFLAYAGDMGSFVFSRLPDMFEFFRMSKDDWNFNRDGGLSINPGYWGEKLDAVNRDGRRGDYMEFSQELFRCHVEDHIKTWIEEFPGPFDCDEAEEIAARKEFEEELREAIEDEVYSNLGDGPHEAFRALNEFDFRPRSDKHNLRKKYQLSEVWEWDCDDYTYYFIWCCYALAWTIRQYDSTVKEESHP